MNLPFTRKTTKRIAARKTEPPKRRRISGSKIGLGLLLWLAVLLLFFSGNGIVPTLDLVEGQKAPATIVSSVSFQCEDLSQTSFNRTQAAEEIEPVFSIDPAPQQRALQLAETLFKLLGQYEEADTNQQSQLVSSINNLLPDAGIAPLELAAVLPAEELANTFTMLSNGLAATMQTGILSDEYRMAFFRDAPDRPFTIVGDTPASSYTVSPQEVYSLQKAWQIITAPFEPDEKRELIERLLPVLTAANMTYDEAATDSLRRKAADEVAPVVQDYPVGTLLVRAGEAATPQTLLLLQAHEQKRLEEQNQAEHFLEMFGSALLLLAGLITTTIILRVVDPELIHRTERLVLFALLSLTTLGFARMLSYASVQAMLIPTFMLIHLVPHALAVLLACVLLGGSAALALGFWCSFSTAIYFDQSFSVFMLGMFATVTAASTLRNVHRRSNLFRAGIWVTGVNILFALILAVFNQPPLSVLGGQIVGAFLSANLAVILTLLFVPVFEKIFRITTDITLLELSDMGHPLLQKMALQAPGTYHHSLMVATLAQKAAEAIGANSLLTRVCAYYHDIGKLAKPEFFSENFQGNNNPHNEVSPHMSALVIVSHVKEGLALAKHHKLPQPILDAIEQHHGNGLISYFCNKAKARLGEDGLTKGLNEADFRYGGSPAVTPEMAILSLADAVEAASRSIEKPTPLNISKLVDCIFDMKIRDGQLDHARLTMAQINTVKKSITFSLSNMLHGRASYKVNEDKTAEPAVAAFDSSAKAD